MDEAWILFALGFVVVLVLKIREISGRFPGIWKDEE